MEPRLFASLLVLGSLAGCAADPTERRGTSPGEAWADLLEGPVVEYRVEELCHALDGAEPRCVTAADGSAAVHLGVADGDVELLVTDVVEMAFVGRFEREVERREMFQLHATWSLDAPGNVEAADAVVRVPTLGTCDAIEQRQLGGRCEPNTHTTACTMTSVAAETPAVQVDRDGDVLYVTFEARVGDVPSRCCEPAVGCDRSARGSFAPEGGVVRGELTATRAP